MLFDIVLATAARFITIAVESRGVSFPWAITVGELQVFALWALAGSYKVDLLTFCFAPLAALRARTGSWNTELPCLFLAGHMGLTNAHVELLVRVFSNAIAPPGILDLATMLSFLRNDQPHVLFVETILLGYLRRCLATTPVLCKGCFMHLNVPRKLGGGVRGQAQAMDHHCIEPKNQEGSEERHRREHNFDRI